MQGKYFIRILKNLFHINKDRYVYKDKKNRKWAYISYIPRVYYKKKNSSWFDKHQNRREALVIGEVFKRLGYNYVMATYDRPIECDHRAYDVIFGEGPCFSIMAKRNPSALKIYYATTAYPEYQNRMVKERTDAFNQKHHTQLLYSRMSPSTLYDLPIDAILQIGSSVTIQTYPMEWRDKISLINQSSNILHHVNIKEKMSLYDRIHFVWMGSSGSILKGLDLVLDFFLHHPELHLHVIGKMDPDFEAYYSPLLVDKANITLWGFQNVNSEEFSRILQKVTFCIYPSASEGCPGAIVTLMKMGIIPLVSQVASFDGIETCGFVMHSLTDKALAEAVKWSQSLSDDMIKQRMRQCIDTATQKWNLFSFEQEFENYMGQQVTKSADSRIV